MFITLYQTAHSPCAILGAGGGVWFPACAIPGAGGTSSSIPVQALEEKEEEKAKEENTLIFVTLCGAAHSSLCHSQCWRGLRLPLCATSGAGVTGSSISVQALDEKEEKEGKEEKGGKEGAARRRGKKGLEGREGKERREEKA